MEVVGGDHLPVDCWCESGKNNGWSVRALVFTFTFLLHKIQDGDGPVRASQESRDALHHPFYLVLFFRSHPAGRSAAGPEARPPEPAKALRPQGAESKLVKNCPPQWPCHLDDSDGLVNVKWSLWQHLRSPQPSGSEASFAGSLRISEKGALKLPIG